MHNFRAIMLMIHRVVKFPAMSGIETMYTKRKVGQEEKYGGAQNMNNNFVRSKFSGGNKMLLEKKGGTKIGLHCKTSKSQLRRK